MGVEQDADQYIRRWNEISTGEDPEDIVIAQDLQMFVEWVIRQERQL